MLLRLDGYPTNYPSKNALFFTSFNNIVAEAVITSFNLVPDGISTVSFLSPSSAGPWKGTGTFWVFPDFGSVQPTSISFPFDFYDDSVQRIVAVMPPSMPTSTTLYGRTVKFDSMPLVVRVENFPQNVGIQDMLLLVASKQATIASVSHQRVPNVTTITLRPGDVPGPAQWPIEIWSKGAKMLDFSVPFFAPCAHDKYCDALQLTGA